MKFLLVLVTIVCVVACNNKPGPASPSRPKLLHPDSSASFNPNVSSPYVALDLSPLDISYCPSDYTKMSLRRVSPVARVVYSRPHKQGRKIFGGLLKYGEPWRLGANEATEIELFRDVSIQGKKVSKGKYILYCIPEQEKWTIVFNSNLYTWGLSIDATKDIHRFEVPTSIKNPPVEYFTLVFETAAYGSDLIMAWDDVAASLPIQYTE